MLILQFLFFFFVCILPIFFFFFFNDTATTEIYTLSLHDALPILFFSPRRHDEIRIPDGDVAQLILTAITEPFAPEATRDRKSTRLNSSHGYISYAVFCLKKKKNATPITSTA